VERLLALVRPASDGKTIQVANSVKGDHVADIPDYSADEANAAIPSART
jgi:acyl-CoA reductase-like NAD-dependent aldehyde dehydrogenase